MRLNAKYCYVLFESRSFLFCIDAVVGKDSASSVIIPAQFLYEIDVDDGRSAIEEYIDNLATVWSATGHNSSSPFEDKSNWPYFAGFVEDEFEIEVRPGSVSFCGTGKLMRHPMGEFAGLVPIPKFGKPTNIPKHGIVVGSLTKKQNSRRRGISSPVHRRHTESVRSALEELTRILWADGGLTTWIMGQPGTGKEVFSQALHHGSGRVKEDQISKKPIKELTEIEKDIKSMGLTDGFAIQSVASVTLEEFSQRLFAVPKNANNNCVVDAIDHLNGTIFLDEFDKPKDPFLLYSSLLRVLEAKQYIKRTYSHTDGQVQETPSTFDNVNWIFAGAFTQIDPREHVPFDLWSRLKGFIQLRNPLEDDANYGATLFLYWYLRLVSGILGRGGDLMPLLKALAKDSADRTYREHVASTLLGQRTKLADCRAFLPSDSLSDFAWHFQRLLNKKTTFSGDRLDSPRGIFKATEAAFNFLRERVFDGAAAPLSDDSLRDDALAEAHKSLRLSRGPS